MIKNIDDCSPHELKGLHEAYKQSFEHYGLPFDATKQAQLIKDLLEAPWFHAFVYLEDGLASAYIFFIDSYSSVEAGRKIRIEEIYVDASKRRSGLGNQLLEHTKAYCREQRIGRIELNTEANNADMLGFYEQAGFTTVPHMPMQCRVSS